MAIIINIDVMLAKRKMSVTELAEKVGITMANISVLKNGKVKAIRLSTMDAAQARAFLAFQYNMMARHFSRPEHVQNVMRGPLDHLVRRFGPTIVPEALGRKVGHSAGSDTGATVSS